MAQYDEKVIEQFAEQLYSEAASLVKSTTTKWTFLGLLGGLIGGAAMENWNGPTYAAIGAVLGGVLCGAIGYNTSTRRVFSLKLQAQTALCQAQIERNTRKSI